MNESLDDAAIRLEASKDYRILRRLNIGSYFQPNEGGETFRAIYLDLETTGLNPDQHEIIEIGMVPFTYGPEGQIYSVEEPYSKLREPSDPISEEITNITNITNDMVSGKAAMTSSLQLRLANWRAVKNFLNTKLGLFTAPSSWLQMKAVSDF